VARDAGGLTVHASGRLDPLAGVEVVDPGRVAATMKPALPPVVSFAPPAMGSWPPFEGGTDANGE